MRLRVGLRRRSRFIFFWITVRIWLACLVCNVSIRFLRMSFVGWTFIWGRFFRKLKVWLFVSSLGIYRSRFELRRWLFSGISWRSWLFFVRRIFRMLRIFFSFRAMRMNWRFGCRMFIGCFRAKTWGRMKGLRGFWGKSIRIFWRSWRRVMRWWRIWSSRFRSFYKSFGIF